MDLDKYFVKSELIPAVIQEHGTNEVLMLAYMNKESLAKTLETGYYVVFLAFKAKTVEQGRNLGSYAKGCLDKGRLRRRYAAYRGNTKKALPAIRAARPAFLRK